MSAQQKPQHAGRYMASGEAVLASGAVSGVTRAAGAVLGIKLSAAGASASGNRVRRMSMIVGTASSALAAVCAKALASCPKRVMWRAGT